jgi:hypothetical protein
MSGRTVLQGQVVNRIVVNGSFGNDAVRFALTGNLVQNVELDVSLGDGNDRFMGTLDHGIQANSNQVPKCGNLA